MERPRCPNPAHAGSRVVRAGWYGKPPHERQRWLCHPGNGDEPHRFTEVLPRQKTATAHCLECSTKIEPWEGQAGPREYLYPARTIAHSLALVARGDTYRQAGEAARINGSRVIGRRVRSVGKSRRRQRRPERDGQIVANWVDTFAPIFCNELLPKRWPDRIAIDAKLFRTFAGAQVRGGMSFYVFVAVGYVGAQEKVWRLEAFPRKTQANWETFLTRLDGAPNVIVSDNDKAIRQAAQRVFPPWRTGTDVRICEWHLKQSITQALSPIASNQQHPIWQFLPRAFNDPNNWGHFVSLVRDEHATGTALPAMMRWLYNNGSAVAAQTATRKQLGPHSIGAAEAVLHKIGTTLGSRASTMTNRRRANLLLGLLALNFSNEVDERVWADRIRAHLHARGGIAPPQRQHDDPKGLPSLVA